MTAIPPDAIEAVASGIVRFLHEDDPSTTTWEAADESMKDSMRKLATAALAAAMPYLLPPIATLLHEVESNLALSEHTPLPDPLHQNDIVKLGSRIGYGALMSGAERAWRDHLTAKGYPVGGEFVSGPCRIQLDSSLKKVREAIAMLEAAPKTGVGG